MIARDGVFSAAIACIATLAAGCNSALGLDTTVVADARGPDLLRGLVAHYTFDSIGAPSCAIDVTGNGHDGACTIGAPEVAPGKVGGAFRFATAPTLIDIPYADALDPSRGFSVTAWVMVEVDPGVADPKMIGCAINKLQGTGEADSYQICLSVGQVAYFGTDVIANTVGAAWQLDEWHHYALTWDGTTTAGWIDGVLRVQAPLAQVISDTEHLTIGADVDSGAPVAALLGRIDELRVYSRALTDAEMKLLAGS